MSRTICLSMLLLLLVAAVAIQAKPHEELTKEHVHEVAEECKAESGASEDDVEHLMKHEPAATHEGKCLLACVMKKFEILDDAGKLSKEHALEMIKNLSKHGAEKDAAAEEIIDLCEAKDVPEDHCDAAAVYEDCIVAHMREHGISTEE
ncbi:Pbprp2 [Drosophila busckii]|uniref:Pbprp2 n=1 Tax=Drosophila busckii TaxID=30019 RepID=A0A0M5JDV8_DROBS|nr:general odorant-binding protein 19d [Drosophila busckii]ALC49606.1 Pbprp2 [Drosophila busckii]